MLFYMMSWETLQKGPWVFVVPWEWYVWFSLLWLVISALFDWNAISLIEFVLILVGLSYEVLDYGFDDLGKFIFGDFCE
jgi:hypothetical protein